MTRPPEPRPRFHRRLRPVVTPTATEQARLDEAVSCAARGLADAIGRSDPDAADAVDFWQAQFRLLVQ